MKIINIILKVLLCFLLVSPIAGALGFFPAPTAEMYNTPEAFAFIEALSATGYLTAMIALVFAIALVLIIMKRMALAALLLLPVTINIIAFHLFLDGGLLTAGAIMGNVLFALNLYFLWQNRSAYQQLLNNRS
ncbi:MAG TPA: hypothetical protein VGE18_00590 [Candidatus Paceibacterota bacterium]